MSFPALCGIALSSTGSLLLLITGITIILRAFRTSVGWGLACLLLPLANILFVIRYWQDMRRVAFYSFGGLALVLLGAGSFLLDPNFRIVFDRAKERGSEALAARQLQRQQRAASDQAERHQRARELFGYLKNWQGELEARRPAANASEAQKTAFEQEHTNYRALLGEYNTLAKQLREASATPAPTPK